MDANFWQNIWQFLSSSVDANVISTLIAGGIGALAVWLTARRSNKMLKQQFEFNKEQHCEQLDSNERQHREELYSNENRTVNSWN